MLAFSLEMLEVATVIYERGWHWSQIGPLLKGPLFGSWVIGQVLILSVIPLVLLGFVVLSNIGGKTLLYLANLGNLLLLMQVLFMRYNVVIGGQLISKSERGFVTFDWELVGHEGVLTQLVILSGPLIAYYIISRFIPILGGSVYKAGKEQ